MEKQRHGFVTFWLWLMCVVNVVCLIIAVYRVLADSGMITIGAQMAGIVGYIVNVVGVCLLINWKKLGFWLFCAACALSLVMNIFSFQMLGYSIGVAILIAVLASGFGVLILWAILQIKKDGVSCWSQLL